MSKTLPAVFLSHGAPTLLIDKGPTREFLRDLARTIGRPRAILCASAHWDTRVPSVTLSPQPETVYDFYGFPDELNRMRYPAPGDPVLAREVVGLIEGARLPVEGDETRGLDHGAWVPLRLMYPEADVPVIELSVQSGRGPAHHLALGEALKPLREKDVLVLGSGGATHNLRDMPGRAVDAEPLDYARDFDSWLCDAVVEGRKEDLLDYQRRGPSAKWNHPTAEHLMPLFVPLGAARESKGRLLHRSFTYGVMSMAAFAWD